MKMYEPIKDKKTARFVKKYDDGYGARNTTLTVSISDDLKNEVKALAQENNESLSNMVNIILANHLKGGSNHGDDIYTVVGETPIALKDFKVIEIRSGRLVRKYKTGQHFKKSFLNKELFKIGVL